MLVVIDEDCNSLTVLSLSNEKIDGVDDDDSEMLLGEDDIDELRGELVAEVEDADDIDGLRGELVAEVEVEGEDDCNGLETVLPLLEEIDDAVDATFEELVMMVAEDDCSPPEDGTVVEGLPVDVVNAILEELKIVKVVSESAEGVLEAIVVAIILVEEAIGAVKVGSGVRVR